MDALGESLIRSRDRIRDKRTLADQLERRAKQLRQEADNEERISELSRSRTTPFPTTKIITESNPTK